LSLYCKNFVFGRKIGVFVLKMNGIALPTPTGQVSAQSDYFCYVKVHLESVRAKTTILIAKVILLKNHKTIVILS
jgi:hypothetical protein